MIGANVLTKGLGLLAVVFVTRMTTEGQYGAYAFAMNLVGAAVPFMGFGAYQAFLRFSTTVEGQHAKRELYRYAFARGAMFSLILIGALNLAAEHLCQAIPESVASFRIVSFVVLTTLVMEHVKSYARAIHRNHISARIDMTYAFTLVSLTVGLTWHFGIVGYAGAVALSPLVASIPFARMMQLGVWAWGQLDRRIEGFWSYGIFTTVGALLAKLFYTVDIYLIGQYVGENASAVAVYRVAILIPMATSILPIAVAATDYVKNAGNKDDAQALKTYVINYWKTFGFLSAAVLGVLALLAPWLLGVFGPNYVEGAAVMRIFLLGSLGAHLLRVPFGHLLSAVGRADWNTYVHASVLVTTVASCMWAIPQWGILGAATAMSCMIWLSGLLSVLMFGLHLQRQQAKPM